MPLHVFDDDDRWSMSRPITSAIRQRHGVDGLLVVKTTNAPRQAAASPVTMVWAVTAKKISTKRSQPARGGWRTADRVADRPIGPSPRRVDALDSFEDGLSCLVMLRHGDSVRARLTTNRCKLPLAVHRTTFN
jgi:hypothetical protein